MLPLLLLLLDPDPSRLSLCIADQGFHKVAGAKNPHGKGSCEQGSTNAQGVASRALP